MEDGNQEREEVQDLKNKVMQLEAETLVVRDSLRLLAEVDDLPYEGKLMNEGIARRQLEAMNHAMTKSKKLMGLSTPGYLGILKPDERLFLELVKSKIAGESFGNGLVYELPNFFQFHPLFIADILQKPWVFLVCPAGPFCWDDQFPKSVIPKGTWNLKKEVIRLFDDEIEVGKLHTYVSGDFSFELYRAHSNPDPFLGNKVGWAIGNLMYKNEKNFADEKPIQKMGENQKVRKGMKRENPPLKQGINENELKSKLHQIPMHDRSPNQLKKAKQEPI